MAERPSSYTATDAEAYQRLMGRWSGALADLLIDWAGVAPGDRVIDIGCGTGSLALALAARTAPAGIVGVDIAAPYIDYARQRSDDPRITFAVGNALQIGYPGDSFDRSFSLIALNFMTEPMRALAEMRRITRSGGTVAAAVWDFPGGLVYQRIFWDTAAALDPEADRARGRHYSSPLTGPGQLAAAFAATGFVEMRDASLTVRMEYADFSDYWEPIRNAQGPVGDYVKQAPPDRLEILANAVRAAYLSGAPDGPRSMAATAWAAVGKVP